MGQLKWKSIPCSPWCDICATAQSMNWPVPSASLGLSTGGQVFSRYQADLRAAELEMFRCIWNQLSSFHRLFWESGSRVEHSPAIDRTHLPAQFPEGGTASTCREVGMYLSSRQDLAAVNPPSPASQHCTAATAGTTTSDILQDCPGTGGAPLPTARCLIHFAQCTHTDLINACNELHPSSGSKGD